MSSDVREVRTARHRISAPGRWVFGRLRSIVTSHPLLSATTGLALVAIAIFVLVYYQPQKLFINTTVHEAAPSLRSASGPAGLGAPSVPTSALSDQQPSVLSIGSFRSYEHSSQGSAVVIQLSDGERFARLENFRTSNGPDLRIYLSTTPSFGPGGNFANHYVELGHLKGNIGDQNYTIPAQVSLQRYASIVVWCKRFSVPFAAAPIVVP